MVQISNTYSIQCTMMTIMGVWHTQSESFFFTCRKIFTWIVFMIAFVVLIILFVNDITDFEKLSQILFLMLSYVSYFCKMVGFTYKRSTFLLMLAHLDDPVFVSFPQELDKYVTRVMDTSIFLTKLYRISCGVVVVLYAIYPVFDDISLPTPIPYELGPYVPVMYAIQCMGILIAAWNNFCLDTLCVSLMGLANSQLDVLKCKIANIRAYAARNLGMMDNCDDLYGKIDHVVNQMLNQCIRHHCAIITFVEQIESIFSFGLLMQFLGSIIVICNTGFFLLMVSPASIQFLLLFVYFITMMSQLTLYCWYGNEIILKSVQISDACYLSDWHTFGRGIRKSLFIIMERSRRPLSVSAGKFSKVSLTAYGSIIQWSYSYFALLRRLEDK